MNQVQLQTGWRPLPPAAQRDDQINILVQAWLNERRQLTALFCALPESLSHTLNVQQNQHGPLLQLCQQLIDYVSAGYFEIYRHLEATCSDEDQAWLRQTVAELQTSTDAVLAFNDLVDRTVREQLSITNLAAEVTQLMHQMEQRFALEDQLIWRCHLRKKTLTH